MFAPPTRHRPAAGRAFTLVELLTAMTVLVLLTVCVAQLVASATAVTTGNRKRLDADSQARVVFDRLLLDFSKMVKRSDVHYLFAKNAGSDTMFFYSEAPGYYDQAAAQASSVALAGYRVNAAYQLERLGKRLSWDGVPGTGSPGGMVFLSPPASPGTSFRPDPASTLPGHWGTAVLGDPPVYRTGTDDGYHTLAEQVFRLEFCYQLQDGVYSTVPVRNTAGITNNLTAVRAPASTDDSSGSSPYAVGSRWYDQTDNCAYACTNNAAGAAVWKFIGLQDVRAVVVAVAVLDATSSRAVAQAGDVTIGTHTVNPPQLNTLVADFADAPLPTSNDGSVGSVGTTDAPYFPPTNAATVPARLMAEAWNNKLRTLLAGGTPPINRTALSQVRVYQRYFPLNNAASTSN